MTAHPVADSGGPRPSGSRRFTAQGASMFVTLLPGDRVEVQAVLPSELSSGDLLVWLSADGKAFTIHRLLGRHPHSGELLTGGDNNSQADPPLPSSAVLGRVRRVERRVLGRYWRLPRVLWSRAWLPAQLSRPLWLVVEACWRRLPLDLR